LEIEADFGAACSACRVSEAFGCLAIGSIFYFTTLEKLVPAFRQRLNGIPAQVFMTLYIYKEIFVDRYDGPLYQSAPVMVDIGANSSVVFLHSHEDQNGAST